MTEPHYTPTGGQHPETAALAAALANQGVVAPHTGEPFSEAMLLGIGGGLGMGYILWEFKQGALRILVLGMRNNWQYPVRFVEALAARLQMPVEILETGGKKRARANLEHALAADAFPIAWVDPAQLAYTMLPAEADGCYGHVVTVAGIDAAGQVLVDDRAAALFAVDEAEFATAQARIPSYKNRVAVLGAPGEFDLTDAVRTGLIDCAEHLHKKSDSFSLPAIRKWARLMTDTRNKKGWPVVFADRRGLYSTLKSVYEGVTPGGPQGGSLRDLYAAFLTEAAPLVNLPALDEIAYHYKYIGVRWSNLGELALPTDVPVFGATKELLTRRQAIFMALGGDGLDELGAIAGELDALDAQLVGNFPLSNDEIAALFSDMQAELEGIYRAEKEANELLRKAVAAGDV